jgi:hypothetical protein
MSLGNSDRLGPHGRQDFELSWVDQATSQQVRLHATNQCACFIERRFVQRRHEIHIVVCVDREQRSSIVTKVRNAPNLGVPVDEAFQAQQRAQRL